MAVAAVLIDVITIPACYFLFIYYYYLFKEAAVGGGAVGCGIDLQTGRSIHDGVNGIFH